MPMSEAAQLVRRVVTCDRCDKSATIATGSAEVIELPAGWLDYIDPEAETIHDMLYFCCQRCAKGYFRAMVEGRLPEHEDDAVVEVEERLNEEANV